MIAINCFTVLTIIIYIYADIRGLTIDKKDTDLTKDKAYMESIYMIYASIIMCVGLHIFIIEVKSHRDCL